MAKPTQRAEVNNFIKGLITEASPLNYPANASLEEENFELNRDGSRDRRLGLGFEPLHNTITVPYTLVEKDSLKLSTFKWLSVAGSLIDDFLVVQIERTLQLYNLNAESLTGSGLIGSITLDRFPPNTGYSFTAVDGTLVVAAGVDAIALVTYKAGVFTTAYERLLVRDSWGIQVVDQPEYEKDITYRGTTALPVAHTYNLQNQSWGIPRKNAANVLVDPVVQYQTDLSINPSNSETVWTGLQFQPVTAGVTFERMYTNLYTEVLGASVVDAKGYYVIDLLNRGTSRINAFAANKVKYPTLSIVSITAPSDITSGGAKIVTEFAGRVWYAGFSGEVAGGDSRSPNLSNYICFSQLIKDKTNFTKCYQEGDPSSRDSTDLVDTDGGFLRVSGAKKIIALVNIESSLIVIADNGVWSVSGGGDYGFSATNYKVAKISTFGGLSATSVVPEGGRVFFWSADGIYLIAKDNVGNLGVTNITQMTIQTLYENIPNTSKLEAVGAYDPISKKVRWLYRTGIRFGDDAVTKELILDTVSSAFYQNRINNLDNNTVQVMSMFVGTPFRRGGALSAVYSGTDLVFAGSEFVGVEDEIRTSGIQSIRYLILGYVGEAVYITIGYYNNTDFADWKGVDGVGVDAKAYLLAGQQTAGDSAISKQIPYLVMYFTRTEVGVTQDLVPDRQSGCLMRCQWDFSNTIVSNKWSPLVQTYRYRRAQYITGPDDEYDNGFSVISSKSKVRGRGKAFSLYLETEPLKDCRVLGWSISLNGNTNV